MNRLFKCPSWILLLVLCLTGCKVELYSGLSESEANQMLALLMLRSIDGEKQVIKEGNVAIKVEKDQFVDAVEVLRQHGLPMRTTESMNDIFPSGQLVTSPVQEQAKINYLKEQLLEKMLRTMEGVVSAQVSIAESVSANRREVPIYSASIFIKHTPGVNMRSREADIRNLIQKGVPNIRAENITVVLQPTDYRYQPAKKHAPKPLLQRFDAAWLGLAATLLVAAIVGGVIAWRRRSKQV